MTYACYINCGHNRTPKISCNMKRISYSNSFTPIKNQRELLTSVVFAINRYQYFTENKNITFCGCKPSQKTTLSLIKIFLALMKKTQRYWMNFKIQRISKDRKVNKLWQELFDQHQLKFKNQACLREREAYNNKSNVLVQA